MDSLIFSLNAVIPIVAMVAIGYVLKKLGMINNDMSKALNKLVFRVFLPVMLFLNVYKIESLSSFEFLYIFYAVGLTLIIFAIAVPLVMLVTPQNERRGVLMQATFRSNYALIGLPLAEALFGQPGIIVASLMSVVTIPVFNILAVISLTVFNKDCKRPDAKKIFLGIAKNPLIQGILLGLVVLGVRAIFDNCGVSFRLSEIAPLMKVLNNLSSLATPLALISLGAQFEFSAIKELRKEIIYGVAVRTVIVPVIGLSIALIFFGDYFRGEHFAAFVALFATPLAVSTVPMTQEMKGDAALAGQLVVWTTLVSGATIFLAAFVLKQIGVF